MPERQRVTTMDYAAEIRALADRMRDLIMRDEMLESADRNQTLTGNVKDKLDEMQQELYEMAGAQELYQLWAK